MTVPTPRKVLRFALLFIPLFAVCVVVYLLVVSQYQRTVFATANVVMAQMDPPTMLHADFRHDWRSYRYPPEGGRVKVRPWSKSLTHLVFLNLAVLPALLLATPIPWADRLRLVLIGFALMFLGHVLVSVLLVRASYCLQQAPGTFLCLFALRVSYTSGQVFAAVIWALLTWKYWFHSPQEDTAS